MAYVPPHRLNSQLGRVASTTSKPKVGRIPLSVSDIQKHYWPTPIRQVRRFPEFSEADYDSDGQSDYGSDVDSIDKKALSEAVNKDDVVKDKHRDPNKTHSFVSTREARTLNATQAEPEKLAYLVLWHNQVSRATSAEIPLMETEPPMDA